jgi:hypothetical protein
MMKTETITAATLQTDDRAAKLVKQYGSESP